MWSDKSSSINMLPRNLKVVISLEGSSKPPNASKSVFLRLDAAHTVWRSTWDVTTGPCWGRTAETRGSGSVERGDKSGLQPLAVLSAADCPGRGKRLRSCTSQSRSESKHAQREGFAEKGALKV